MSHDIGDRVDLRQRRGRAEAGGATARIVCLTAIRSSFVVVFRRFCTAEAGARRMSPTHTIVCRDYSLYDGQPFPRLAAAIRWRDEARVAEEVARVGASTMAFAKRLWRTTKHTKITKKN
jgi:hypothetical protein